MRVMLSFRPSTPLRAALETAPQTAQQALPAGFVLDTDYEPRQYHAAGHRARRDPFPSPRRGRSRQATTR